MTFYSFILYLLLLSGCGCFMPSGDFREVEFSAGLCEGTCPQFSITINETGASTYVAGMFNDREGTFTTVIKPAQFDSLKYFIAKADLNSLPDTYATQATDMPSYQIKVSFPGGTTKTIDDYGPAGPRALQELYGFIFSLRETQDWK
ncbi:DUF6438 domain-containing protein [Terrimonas rubra]|uniref:DUF6438 domain-containing protein n=1 Tax=Terrimonas rubra TaxID=1035890 RepID=A0ABW6A1T9_9BACT